MSDSLTIGTPQSGSVQEPVRTSGNAGASGKGSTSSSDRIDLQSQSGLLSLAQAVNSPQMEERIQQLRALVQSGQYQVDSPTLADSMVNAALNGY
ncbi:MAG TPA: flagellar biosynthesis anti-sigma factor FlgM [Bryobacteraceae bacterium]|nr:flagellar biosynthesis anti-sigma factor FlgM [Bryobacteraceae bacterium]